MKPKLMVKQLEKAVKRFQKKVLMSEDGKSGIETCEGEKAYVEAIEFLLKQKTVPPLVWSKELSLAA